MGRSTLNSSRLTQWHLWPEPPTLYRGGLSGAGGRVHPQVRRWLFTQSVTKAGHGHRGPRMLENTETGQPFPPNSHPPTCVSQVSTAHTLSCRRRCGSLINNHHHGAKAWSAPHPETSRALRAQCAPGLPHLPARDEDSLPGRPAFLLSVLLSVCMRPLLRCNSYTMQFTHLKCKAP